jgi:hypothetical protein
MSKLVNQKPLGGALHPRTEQGNNLTHKPQAVVWILQRGERGFE